LCPKSLITNSAISGSTSVFSLALMPKEIKAFKTVESFSEIKTAISFAVKTELILTVL
jgi:hypothetical protein